MAVNSAGVNFGKPNEEFIIESDGSGALTSARNAVTGDEYVGGGGVEILPIWLTITNSSGNSRNVSWLCCDANTPENKYAPYGRSHSTGGSNILWTHPVIINGEMLFTVIGSVDVSSTNNCSVTKETIVTGATTFHIVPDAGATSISFTYVAE